MLYEVSCPALNEREVVNSLDEAMDLCFSMSEESKSYARIEDQFGNVVGEYGDIIDGIAALSYSV